MHFLLDANVPRSVTAVVEAAGYGCTHVRDTPLSNASDEELATYAVSNELTLLTRDFDFADIRAYPPERFLGIVVLSTSDSTTAPSIAGLVAEFLNQQECLENLAGRLAIVEFGRVRLRPKP